MSSLWERSFVGLGAVAGLVGVAMSAAAAHITGGGSLDIAARFCLVHAPVLLALAALIEQRLIGRLVGRAAALVLTLGLILFAGDLAVRATLGVALLPLAAPVGGVLLMLGWALIGVAGLWNRSCP